MRPIRLCFVTSGHRTTPQHDTDVAETLLVVRSCGTTVFSPQESNTQNVVFETSGFGKLAETRYRTATRRSVGQTWYVSWKVSALSERVYVW